MMLEQHSMESAELYALGLLGETESADFEKNLRRDEDLRLYLQELENTMAGIALTAPGHTPPSGTFDAIAARIQAESNPFTRRLPRLAIPVWAAAALVMLSGISVQQIFTNRSHQREIAELKTTLESVQADDLPPGDSRVARETPSPTPSGKEQFQTPNSTQLVTTRSHYLLSQDLTSLKGKLAKIKAANKERFTPQNGVSRMVVIEMLNPVLSEDERESRRMVLSQDVSDILATGLEVEAPIETPANEIKLSGEDNSWEGDIVIEEGMVNMSIIDLPKGTIITHKNFPLDDLDSYRGIEALPGGLYYDRYGDILWRPGPEGDYLGFRPDEQPTPQNIPEIPEQPSIETPDPEARAFTLFDETTGQGSIIVSDIPPAADGQIYQLWMKDPAHDQPISLGVVPQLENGAGRIFFELPESGFSPSNYQLTSEPAGGSYSPTGPTILSGP